MRRAIAACALGLVSIGCLLLTEQGWLAAKARVAELLIGRAFAAHLADGDVHRPWSWADTHPVAQLDIPRLGLRRTVLEGATGSSLAFGPGHVDGTAAPNSDGNCMLAGHRDSWFAFLERLRIGDRVVLRTRSGVQRYVVRRLAVADRLDTTWFEPTASSRLTLVTCFPFNGLRRSDSRYIVVCELSATSA